MDSPEQTSRINNLTHHSAYLFVGNTETISSMLIKSLQETLCCSDATCNQCEAIAQKTHHQLLWLSPKKNYTRDQLEPLFHTTSFALDEGEHFFIVLEQADYLNQACANSLLKLLEEPPPGYHFLLLAQRKEFILPTICSRCIIHNINEITRHDEHPLITLFINPLTNKHHEALNLIEQNIVHEKQSLDLMEVIYAHWLDQHKKNSTKKTEAFIHVLSQTLKKPPMPGSAKMFWKNLYLQMMLLHFPTKS